MTPWGYRATPRPSAQGWPRGTVLTGTRTRRTRRPPAAGTGQDARAEVTVPAAVSAPRPGAQHGTGRWAAPGPLDPRPHRWSRTGQQRPLSPRPARGLRGAGPSAPPPSRASPAAAAGPALRTHLEAPRRCRQHPCPPWSRSPRRRAEPPAQRPCPRPQRRSGRVCAARQLEQRSDAAAAAARAPPRAPPGPTPRPAPPRPRRTGPAGEAWRRWARPRARPDPSLEVRRLLSAAHRLAVRIWWRGRGSGARRTDAGRSRAHGSASGGGSLSSALGPAARPLFGITAD